MESEKCSFGSSGYEILFADLTLHTVSDTTRSWLLWWSSHTILQSICTVRKKSAALHDHSFGFRTVPLQMHLIWGVVCSKTCLVFLHSGEVQESVLKNHDLSFRWTAYWEASKKLRWKSSQLKIENRKLRMLPAQLWNCVARNLIVLHFEPKTAQIGVDFLAAFATPLHEFRVKFTIRVHDPSAPEQKHFVYIVSGIIERLAGDFMTLRLSTDETCNWTRLTWGWLKVM